MRVREQSVQIDLYGRIHANHGRDRSIKAYPRDAEGRASYHHCDADCAYKLAAGGTVCRSRNSYSDSKASGFLETPPSHVPLLLPNAARGIQTYF